MILSYSRSKKVFCLIFVVTLFINLLNPSMIQGFSAPEDIIIKGKISNEKGEAVWNYYVTLEYYSETFGTTRTMSTSTNSYGNYSFTIDSIYADALIGKQFKITYTNYGVAGLKSERTGCFTSSENIYDLDVITYGTSIIHVIDAQGNPAPSGVPIWVSYTSPITDGTGWPWTAPADGITPHFITNNGGNVSIYMEASWMYDGIPRVDAGSLGGFRHIFPAGYKAYGGLDQSSLYDSDNVNHAVDLHYEHTGDFADVSSQAGKTVEYNFVIKPLGKVITRAIDSLTGLPLEVDYYDINTTNNFTKYFNYDDETKSYSLYAYGNDQLTMEYAIFSDPSKDYLGYQTSSDTINIIPWHTVHLDIQMIRDIAGSIKGRVVDTDGFPISDASVNLIYSQMAARVMSFSSVGNGLLRTINTDADGYFTFENVIPTGDAQGYLVQATKAGYSISYKNISVASGQEVIIEDNFIITPDIEAPYWESNAEIIITDIGRTAVIIEFPNAIDNVKTTKYELYSNGILLSDNGYITGNYRNKWFIRLVI